MFQNNQQFEMACPGYALPLLKLVLLLEIDFDIRSYGLAIFERVWFVSYTCDKENQAHSHSVRKIEIASL